MQSVNVRVQRLYITGHNCLPIIYHVASGPTADLIEELGSLDRDEVGPGVSRHRFGHQRLSASCSHKRAGVDVSVGRRNLADTACWVTM